MDLNKSKYAGKHYVLASKPDCTQLKLHQLKIWFSTSHLEKIDPSLCWLHSYLSQPCLSNNFTQNRKEIKKELLTEKGWQKTALFIYFLPRSNKHSSYWIKMNCTAKVESYSRETQISLIKLYPLFCLFLGLRKIKIKLVKYWCELNAGQKSN